MKAIVKKSVAILIAVIMIFGSVSFADCCLAEAYSSQYVYEDEDAGYRFTIDSNRKATIMKVLAASYSVSIPSYFKVTNADESVSFYEVVSIGQNAFKNVDSINILSIPYTVKNIDDYAFSDCNGLRTVSIGSGVKEISETAFYKCQPKNFKVDSNNDYYSSDEDGVLYNKNKTVLIKSTTSVSEDYTVSDSVVRIGGFAFSYNYKIKNIVLNDNTTDIGNFAFFNCMNLESVTLPEGLKSIGENVFEECSESFTAYYPGNPGQWGWISVNIANPNLIDRLVYESASDNPYYYGSLGDDLNWKVYLNPGDALVVSGNGKIPDIASSSRMPWKYHKNEIKTVVIEDGIDGIGDYSFYEFTRLQRVIIPDSLTEIGKYAFYRCHSIKTISVPAGLAIVGDNAFDGCTGLSDVYYAGTEQQWYAMDEGAYNYSFYEANIHFNSEGPIKTITWIVDDTQTTEEYTVDKEITVPDEPYKKGFVFIGWADADGNGVPGRMPDNDLTFTAVFEEVVPDEYSVTWIVDGVETTERYTEGETVIIPSDPTKDGYTFIGWSPEVPEVMPDRDMIFTAVFEEIPEVYYTVTWKVDDSVTTQKYKEGDSVITPPQPEKNGFTFIGWSPDVPATMPAKDATFTAVFEKIASNIYSLGEETYSFDNFGDMDSVGGHCFGMSVTSSGYYIGELDVNKIGISDSRMLHTLGRTAEVKAPICHYQFIQGYYSAYATVAGGSAYLSSRYDIGSDWAEVVNYVKNHDYDGTGLLQIGIRKNNVGGHAINFLRYEEVNGQARIYAYDNNFPDTETYFYMDSDGKVRQAPYSTFGGAIDCIALRSIPKYLEIAGTYNSTRYIYADKSAITVENATVYLIEGGVEMGERVVFAIPDDVAEVVVVPHVDNAEFVYIGEEYSFDAVNDYTYATFTLSDTEDYSAENSPELKVINGGDDLSVVIRQPSITTVTSGDSIVLHADIEGVLPEGAIIDWGVNNGNFAIVEISSDGKSCTLTPDANGDTVVTVVIFDAEFNEICSDEQTMTSKAGFFQKIIAFFKKLFGLTKVIPEAFKKYR